MFASAHPYAHFLRVWLTVLALLGAWPAHAAFTDNGDGTVTDTVTLLIWDKCSWGQSGNACATGSASTHSLAAALGVAVTANASFYKGKNDWRLPNARELESLVNLNGSQPATDSTTFPNTQLAGYWSSTIGTHHPGADPTGAVIVDFLNGYTYAFLNIPNHVRLVRSGQSFSSFDSFPAGTSLTPQTINIDTSPTSLVVGGTGTVSATASSGLPVIFSSRTPWLCTVSGNTVTGVGVGLCNVNVDQPGDARYSPAITALALINIVAPTAYTLYVNSIGASGVAIAASPTTYAGISNYGTGMMGGTSLTLTAPSRAGNATFSNWSGCDVTSGVTCALTMLNADRSVTALYNTSSLLSQSITFGAAPSVTVGGTGRVSATATSGLAVTFSSIDTTATCSVSGSTVTGLAAGTCVLTANQSGDARYSPAPPTKQVFNVGASTSLLSQSITFGTAPSVALGGTGTVSATATSGLAVSFSSVTTGICSVSGSTVTGLAAGTCILTANQSGNTRYSPAPQAMQSFNVVASTGYLSQSITFGTAPSVTVGGTGTLSATSTSGLAVSFSSVTTGICSVSGSTVTGLAAGTCILTANQSGNARYSPAPQAMQSFNVVASTAYLSQSITFGTAPSVAVGGTGTVSATATSGLAVSFSSVTTGICSVSGSTVTGLAAGTCILTANQSGNTRYSPAPQAMQSFNVVASTGYTLTVNSTGASGVAIGASPTTYSGTSNYSKTGIAAGASIILSAPSSAGSATFSNWSGCDATSGSICALTLNASRGVTALYNTSLLSQSITFGTAPGVAVGGTGTVSATATSGLVVSFSSVTTGICSVSGSTVTGLAAGTCILTANQSGDARYSPAPQAMQTFAIAAGSAAPNPPTNITITAGSGSAMLNFSISTDTDGSPITHYTATCSANGQTTRTATGSASPLTVKNLSGNVAYQCSLTATNGSGLTSSASDPLPVTPMPAKKSGLTPILMLLFE